MPHSKPSRTSVASSLNRRSDSIVRLSETTMPSRTRRARLLRVIVPERTMQPATVPTLGTRKTPPHLRGAQLGLLEDGLQHALERGLDLLDRLVDHRVVADVHAHALGQLARPARGPDVEADDHG